MPRTGWSPGIVPIWRGRTVYLVVDCFSGGAVDGETNIDAADLETVVADLLSGQYKILVRIVALNTGEQWSADVSADVAAEIRSQCDMDGSADPRSHRRLR